MPVSLPTWKETAARRAVRLSPSSRAVIGAQPAGRLLCLEPPAGQDQEDGTNGGFNKGPPKSEIGVGGQRAVRGWQARLDFKIMPPAHGTHREKKWQGDELN